MKIQFKNNANDLYFLQNKQKVFEQNEEILENYNFIVENLENEIEFIENKNGVCTVCKYIWKKQYYFNENLFEDNQKEEIKEIEENEENDNNINFVKHKQFLKNNVKNIFVFVFVLSLLWIILFNWEMQNFWVDKKSLASNTKTDLVNLKNDFDILTEKLNNNNLLKSKLFEQQKIIKEELKENIEEIRRIKKENEEIEKNLILNTEKNAKN